MLPPESTGFARKLRRLTSMGPRELVHRVGEKGITLLERARIGTPDAHSIAGMSFQRCLMGPASERFFRGPSQDLRAIVSRKFPQWIDRAVKDADALCRHEIDLLDYGTIQLGPEIDWHRDPITGCSWEKLFWTRYNPELNHGGRDSKLIHELNRHQHLPRLAKAWRLTSEASPNSQSERYAAEAVAQMIGWIGQNPPDSGINWQSSLEIAIRCLSWMWTLFLLFPSRALDEARAQRIGDSLFAQLEHVYRHTSRFSSPNTHLIGEAAALFTAGLLFRDEARPAAWLERGAAFLAEAAESQVLDDGVHGELSAYYHCYALDFFLQALILADRNEYPLPAVVRRKVHGMMHFLMHVTRPDGTLPLIGDCDGGRALALVQRDYKSPASLLCSGAVVFLRNDFKHQSGEFHEDTLWLFGDESLDVYDLLKSASPCETSSLHPAAGFAIQRSGWGSLDNHVVFDFGGLGILTGGHAHADSLSFVLFSGGREVLSDPGTFVYNCAPEWRAYARSTRAHNTVCIDGLDQAQTGGTFCWKSGIHAHGSVEHGYLEGEHDGYAPLGITHRRRLVNIPGNYWIVVDDFRGTGRHTFESSFHFAPGVTISEFKHYCCEAVVRTGNPEFALAVHASYSLKSELILGQCDPVEGQRGPVEGQRGPVEGQRGPVEGQRGPVEGQRGPVEGQRGPVEGQRGPVEGWISRGYGDKIPATTMRAGGNAAVPATAMTFLLPHPADTTPARLPLDDSGVVACSFKRGDIEDIAVSSAGKSEFLVAGFRLCGEFFWIRKEKGIVVQKFSIGATRFEHIDEKLLESDLCAQSAGS